MADDDDDDDDEFVTIANIEMACDHTPDYPFNHNNNHSLVIT